MLVQTMKAIALRFQNQRTSDRDPLASFDIAPLYPLSNILWGYIQDENNRKWIKADLFLDKGIRSDVLKAEIDRLLTEKHDTA